MELGSPQRMLGQHHENLRVTTASNEQPETLERMVEQIVGGTRQIGRRSVCRKAAAHPDGDREHSKAVRRFQGRRLWSPAGMYQYEAFSCILTAETYPARRSVVRRGWGLGSIFQATRRRLLVLFHRPDSFRLAIPIPTGSCIASLLVSLFFEKVFLVDDLRKR